MKQRLKINNFIRASELRIINDNGENLGVLSLKEALKLAEKKNLDLIEISADSVPPVAKITDYGKFQYEQKKKAKESKAKAHSVETKVIQIKIGTGEHDLNLKATNVSKWLNKGHRVKIDLFLVGRIKYTEDSFKQERLNRILNLITVDYKVVVNPQRSPKGFTVIIEKIDKNKQQDENK
ncbi:translation initiation factor IF-3 [Patescibacteria group bacterium]|nr:translation initiation factor IF-3 [Patescibacteria group bacterium]MBU1246943.1 translation initiation factor IF-3 [Patescibacteria group bacterium]MBU1519587.1 translation initiation factor IF-3 [Patescibacteria group bacterium]MBU1730461.1 translation initiation factor IF-3 [Patescibacteria group bacterium]MBU1956283.1 translation initiation factor IF-3 [Patescibacteria group bacterium]